MADNEYLNLAQTARPTMMPEAPMGAGLWAGMDYQNQQARQDGYLQQAAGLAGMGALEQTQKHQEFMAGAPGRMADIDVKNAMSANAQQNIPLQQEAATSDLNEKISGNKDKERKRKQEALEDLSEQWAAIPQGDTTSRNQIIMDMSKLGIKPGGKPIEEMSPQEQEHTMQRIRKASIENRETMRKALLEKVKGDEREQLEEIRSKAKMEIADKLIKARKAIAEAVQKDKNPGQAINRIHQQLLDEANSEPDPVKRKAKVLEVDRFIQESKLAVEQAKAGNKPAQTDIDFGNGQITSRPPEKPQPATFGGKPDEVDQNLKPGSTWNGQRVLGVARDASGKVRKVHTADGQTHDVK